MFKTRILPVLVAGLCLTGSAQASISNNQLIAIGTLTGSSAGSYADLSGLTGTLENGVAANLLGGIGSGLAYAGGNTFIATPDRGPNAVAYNTLVDDTTSYIARFHTLTLDLTPNTSGTGLAYNLTPNLTATTLLSSKTALNYGTGVGLNLPNGAPALNTTNNFYFTGRSDNFGSNDALNGGTNTTSSNPSNGRYDPEGVRVSNDGKSVFISDEYGPYVNQFDRATGERIRSFALPANLAVANQSSQGKLEEAPNNTTGRVDNKGMEGLAITPDGKTLVGIVQAPLLQDSNSNVRIVTIDIATGATHEYAYHLTTGSGVSEIVAINSHEFLVDERDGKGLGSGNAAVAKQLFKIDLNGAVDISNLTSSAADQTALSTAAVSKTLFLDVKAALVNNGISATQIPSKLEGVAFGQDITDNGQLFHTLYVANDNDFLQDPTTGSGPNKFYVFAVADSAVSYQAQQFAPVPVPGAVWLFGSAMIGLGLTGKRRKS